MLMSIHIVLFCFVIVFFSVGKEHLVFSVTYSRPNVAKTLEGSPWGTAGSLGFKENKREKKIREWESKRDIRTRLPIRGFVSLRPNYELAMLV